MSSYEPLRLEQTLSKNGFDSILESALLCYLLHLNPLVYPEPDVADAMPLGQGSPTFITFKWELLLGYQLTLRATNLIHASEIKKFAQFTFKLSFINVNLWDDTHHFNVIFKNGPRVTYVVLAGDLVPAGTVLVNPALG